MKNKNVFLLLLIGTVFNGVIQSITPLKFKSKRITTILTFIDGITNAIDGVAIKDLNKVIFQINALQHGIQDPKTKKVIGKYIIDKKRYTISELAEGERKNTLPVNDASILEDVLKQICDDFGKIVGPFYNRVKGLKDFLIELIEEECQIRNNMKSGLLDWSRCKGNEPVIFERTIFEAHKAHKGFSTMNDFLTDLALFFEDLKFNCPIACKQYDEIKRLAQGHKSQALDDGKDYRDH